MNKVQLHKQITPDEALKRAKEYGLTKEMKDELDHGATPWEALYEWDLLEIEELEKLTNG